uniref:Gamma-retroviral matrix protein domain-containing protein n=1 Tax=Molossus molossus TaxID=27622 RepID=A0A7J8GQQ4_MOLMO|nr:hypothetical protein HJG59_011305 [Molossus molossus]
MLQGTLVSVCCQFCVFLFFLVSALSVFFPVRLLALLIVCCCRLIALLFDVMGQSQSGTKTPLQCLLDNFKDFKAQAKCYNVPVSSGTLRTLCKLKWSTFGDNWPPEGNFNLQLAFMVYQKIYGSPGHPDQMPYIKKCQCPEVQKKEKTVLLTMPQSALKNGKFSQSPKKLYPIL